MIMRTLFPILVSAAALATAPAVAQKQKAAVWPPDQLDKPTSIPFVALGNIDNFEADSDDGVWLQDRSRRWYYATVAGPCPGLPFAIRIGVDTRFGGNQLDGTGRLLVDGQPCQLSNLVASNGPPKKKKSQRR